MLFRSGRGPALRRVLGRAILAAAAVAAPVCIGLALFGEKIAVLLGGRTAEEIHYGGVVSTGAADDLERATALIRQMITRFGMSGSLGPLTYGRSLAGQYLKSPLDMEERNYSELTAQQIDIEARRIMDETHTRVTGILIHRREPMERISRELIRKETLERVELDKLLNEEAPQTQPVPVTSRWG